MRICVCDNDRYVVLQAAEKFGIDSTWPKVSTSMFVSLALCPWSRNALIKLFVPPLMKKIFVTPDEFNLCDAGVNYIDMCRRIKFVFVRRRIKFVFVARV